MHQLQNHNLIFSTKRFICLLFVLVAAAVHAQTTTFQLLNGDRITGLILNENTNRVAISNAWSKEIVIPLAEIKSRHTNAPVVAITNAPPKVMTNAPVVAKPAPAPVAPKPASVAAVKPKAFKDWHGDVQVGGDVGLGETTRELYYARFKVTYAPVSDGAKPGSSKLIDRFRNTFDYNASYGTITTMRTNTTVSANQMYGSSKTDFDLAIGQRAFVYNLFGAGYDQVRLIDFRYEVGPGIGYHLFTRTNFVMNAEVGMNYQAQYFQNNTETERVYYRFAEDLTWKISKMLTFDEKFEIFPEVNFNQYRMRFESNLRYWLLQNLSLNLTVLDTYDTQVAPHIDKNDLQIRSSVGVKF
jgi:hypothetical protein